MDPEFIAHLGERGLTAAEYSDLSPELKAAMAASYHPRQTGSSEPVWDYFANRPVSVGGTVDLGLNGSFTFMCWINIKTFNTGGQGDNTILGQRECRENSTLHLVIRNRCPYFGFYCNDTPGRTVLAANTWYHICITYNMTERRQTILVNGVVDASSVGHVPLRGNIQTFYSYYADGRSLNGYIAVPRFWRSAMSAEHIRDVMMIGIASPVPRHVLDTYGHSGLEQCRPQQPSMKSPINPPPLQPTPIFPKHTFEGAGVHSEFGYLYNQEQFSDVVIRYNGRQLFAHKAVLAARCDYFRAMFSSGMRESTTGVVELSDIHDEMVPSLECFVALLYTYEMKSLADLQSVMGALMFAIRYDAPILRGLLQCKATEYITSESAAEVLAAIEGTNCTVLESYAMSFIIATP